MADMIVLPCDDSSGDEVSPGPSGGVGLLRRAVMKRPSNASLSPQIRILKKPAATKRFPYHHGPGLKSCFKSFQGDVPEIVWPLEVPLDHGEVLIPDHFWEIYCPPRIAPLLPSMNARSFDLQNGWNLDDVHSRGKVMDQHMVRKPLVTLCCPPCTMFSTLMFGNWFRMEKIGREARLKTGLSQLKFAMSICERQVNTNAYYIFEHPHGALSWGMDEVVDLDGVMVEFHQCRFGLHGPDGELLKKPTIIKTNIPSLVDALKGMMCKGDHKHGTTTGQHKGKVVTKWSQVYPPALCDLIAKEVRGLVKARL